MPQFVPKVPQSFLWAVDLAIYSNPYCFNRRAFPDRLTAACRAKYFRINPIYAIDKRWRDTEPFALRLHTRLNVTLDDIAYVDIFCSTFYHLRLYYSAKVLFILFVLVQHNCRH